MNYLRSKGIITQVHYIPLMNHPLFKKYVDKKNKLKNAITYYHEALSLPLYYSLKENEQSKVIKELKYIVG